MTHSTAPAHPKKAAYTRAALCLLLSVLTFCYAGPLHQDATTVLAAIGKASRIYLESLWKSTMSPGATFVVARRIKSAAPLFFQSSESMLHCTTSYPSLRATLTTVLL